MLATGLVLYLPSLSSLASRPTAKAVHLAIAVAWLTTLVAIPVLGNRRQLRRTRMEIERFVDDDLRWLMGKRTPQGRFNAGQKVHTILQAAIAGLFTVSGTLLWLGERNTTFRLSGSIALHDLTMYVAVALVVGHLFLALVWPTTRPALRGIVRGAVRKDWATVHHAAWAPGLAPSVALSARREMLGLAVGVIGIAGGWWVVHGVLDSAAVKASAPVAKAPVVPARVSALQLAGQAQALDQAGQLPQALALYQQAVAALPKRADLRAALGFAQARAGDPPLALRTLSAAVKLDPGYPDAHLYLGAVLLHVDGAAGHVGAADKVRGRRELRRFLVLAPDSPNAPSARQLLHGR
ncbi:cytochrome b/b6 domain-containing protein [Paraconexibacter antarcticus]|uniref:Cytochrome b/b6 domain-containing protein n=2 Tax=Paraconexibacter antarcticus TaxID=2949664 RepID=A0ABY5DST9_9ACTN|nr:cytochrome b/b6 domain-containing protein [Paraconexibacter antarcticus]